MNERDLRRPTHETIWPVRLLAEQSFSRAAGAPLVPGNSVRVLKDAQENYPAWLEAIHSAEKSIHFESYIIHEDDIGDQFAQALAAKAQEGVRVRLIYDGLGAVGKTSYRFWQRLREAGVEVRWQSLFGICMMDGNGPYYSHRTNQPLSSRNPPF